MTELIATDLDYSVKGAGLVRSASFQLAPRDFIAILGPNGAGKTSLIRAALGLEKPTGGSATLKGQETHRISPIERARSIAYLPQVRPLAWPNIVRDVVALAAIVMCNYWAPKSQRQEAVDEAIIDCDLSDLADRNADALSGGELARMHCARALAAKSPLLIADEPTAALDPRHQFRILDLIGQYVAQGGGALVVLHDIQLAARYASRLIWMKDGKIVADGSPRDTLTAERLDDVYGIKASHGRKSLGRCRVSTKALVLQATVPM